MRIYIGRARLHKKESLVLSAPEALFVVYSSIFRYFQQK